MSLLGDALSKDQHTYPGNIFSSTGTNIQKGCSVNDNRKGIIIGVIWCIQAECAQKESKQLHHLLLRFFVHLDLDSKTIQ